MSLGAYRIIDTLCKVSSSKVGFRESQEALVIVLAHALLGLENLCHSLTELLLESIGLLLQEIVTFLCTDLLLLEEPQVHSGWQDLLLRHIEMLYVKDIILLIQFATVQ